MQDCEFQKCAKRTFYIALIYIACIAMAFGGPATCISTVVAQSNSHNQPGQSERQSERQFGRPQFGNPTAEPAAKQPWKFEGRLHLQQGSTEGYIVLQVDLAPGHYIYSVSPEGSPAPTRIEVVPSPNVKTADSFSPDQPPLVIENDPVFERRIEKHVDRVQFFVPCQLDPNADYKVAGLPVIEFNGQVCSKDGVCIPVRKQRIEVNFAGYFQQESGGQTKTMPSSGGVRISAQATAAGITGNPAR